MVDYSLYTNEEEIPPVGIVLKRARAKSAGGTLTDRVQPGGSVLPNAISALRERAAAAYEQGQRLYDAEPDMSQLQAYAKAQGQAGDAAMLNALAAQFAGEGFAPVQSQFLKRAAAAKEPLKVSGGMLTPDGQFLKDPAAAQDKKAEFLLQQAKAYETLAQTAETARERIAAQREANARMEELKMMGLRIQQDSNAIRRENAAATQALAAQGAADRKEKQLGEGTQKLSKQSEDLTNLVSGVRQLTGALAPYIAADKNIPGVGYGTNISALGLDLSGAVMGKEGKANRSLVRNVSNELLRLASGQAVTLGETERQNLALMATGNYSEEDFLNALNNVIIPKVNEAVANVGAGYSADIKNRYRDQGGKIDFGRPFETLNRPGSKAAPASNLSAQEQAELEALRKRYGKGTTP